MHVLARHSPRRATGKREVQYEEGKVEGRREGSGEEGEIAITISQTNLKLKSKIKETKDHRTPYTGLVFRFTRSFTVHWALWLSAGF